MNNKEAKIERVYLLDELRGFAIVCMVCYHTFFDLRFIFGVPVPIFFDSRFDVVRDVFAGLFIFISGVCTQYSRGNLRRGVQCFFCGMVLPFVTAFAAPETPILFGILHFLGAAMMIYGLIFDNRQYSTRYTSVIFITAAVLFILTKNVQFGTVGAFGLNIELPPALYNAGLLFPLGFRPAGAGYGDYFPILPWLFCFAAGTAAGVWVKSGVCPLGRVPAFVYRKHLPLFGTIGRYTIWVYMLHQPVVYFILKLVL